MSIRDELVESVYAADPDGTINTTLARRIVDSVLSRYVVIEIPEPDELVTDRRPGFEGETFPAWYPNGSKVGAAKVAIGGHPGVVEVQYGGGVIDDPEEAQRLAAALLAAAKYAEEQ